MTPLMDLTFILLITFIITFPLIEEGIPVNLPKGEASEIEVEESKTISLDIKNQLYLDEIPIAINELLAEMQQLANAQPDITIFVRADENLPYGQVVNIMKTLHQANISRMALVTQSEKQ